MVGLDAVVAYTDELERQLARLEELPADEVAGRLRGRRPRLPQAPDLPGRTGQRRAAGPAQALPRIRGDAGAARTAGNAAPTDLFYPDLSPRAPKIAPREIVPRQQAAVATWSSSDGSTSADCWSWLRGDAAGAVTMRDAIAGIEDVTTQGSLRAFWWTVGAMLEGMVEGGLDGGFGVKQLAARLDLQIRRVAEGSAKAAERLRREVLYFVAISAPVGPQVQAVQRAFKLSGLIPSAEVLSADVVRLQPLLREAREQLAGAKDAWLKAASGRAENLPKLKQTLASVHAKAAEIHNGALMKLTSALVERLDKMPSSGVSEPRRDGIRDGAAACRERVRELHQPVAGFPEAGRRDAGAAGRGPRRDACPASASAPMLDEMSKRAQERVLLAQVGREIQTNLRHMEQVLDAFFRDNGKRVELASLAKDSAQISGALRILGLDGGRPPARSLRAADRDLRAIRIRRFPTTTSNCWRSRCPASGSTSRRSSSSARIATV